MSPPPLLTSLHTTTSGIRAPRPFCLVSLFSFELTTVYIVSLGGDYLKYFTQIFFSPYFDNMEEADVRVKKQHKA